MTRPARPLVTPASLPRVGITAVGAHLPDQVVDTADLQARVERASGLRLPRGLFRQMTGIDRRRVARDDEYASTLALGAARAGPRRRRPRPARHRPAGVRLGHPRHGRARHRARRPGRTRLEGARVRRHQRLQQLPQRHRRGPFDRSWPVGPVARWWSPARRRPGPCAARLASMAQARDAFAGFTFGDAGAAVVVEPVARGGILDIDTETHSEHWPVGGIIGGGLAASARRRAHLLPRRRHRAARRLREDRHGDPRPGAPPDRAWS